MLDALRVVADSWPIAVMVIGLSFAGVIRGAIRRSQDAAQIRREISAKDVTRVRDGV